MPRPRGKYTKLGLPYPVTPSPSEPDQVSRAAQLLQTCGLSVRIGEIDERTHCPSAPGKLRDRAGHFRRRALLETRFYKDNHGKHSLPVLRALVFKDLCRKRRSGWARRTYGQPLTRLPRSRADLPGTTCYSADDLRVLNSRLMTRYHVAEDDITAYEREVIPYWTGRSTPRARLRPGSDEWRAAYEAGLFTEFMEQRAPGHARPWTDHLYQWA